MASIPNLTPQEMFQAQIHVYNHLLLYIKSMSLKCCLELGIPDIIHKHGKPITLPELASSLGIQPSKVSCLYRLMNMLVRSGFFVSSEVANRQEILNEGQKLPFAYDLTLSSRLLVRDNPNCLTPMMHALVTPELVSASGSLAVWFRGDGKTTPFEQAHNVAVWEWLSDDKNLEASMLFNEAMASDSQIINLVIGESKRVFEGLRSVVDVGGGTGALARAISEAIPDIKCTVLDLPPVVANLTGTKNLEFVGGNMFRSIPPADAVILKLILHSWTDEQCVKILEKCKEAISGKGKGGKVIIIDVVIDEKKDEHQVTETKLLFDMLMMTVVTGKERSEKDWEQLFLEAGYSHYKITPLFGLRSLIQLYP